MRPKRNKYGAVKTTVDGIKFDSKAESRRYEELKLLELVGRISGLELQKKFILAEPCVVKGRKRPARYYIADFVYIENGEQIVEDSKGVVTPMYSFKRHLMKSIHGIDIVETY
jgi:hypothetical protein